MEKNTEPKKTGGRYKTKTPSRGGAREGAGRPTGSVDRVTVEGLLAELKEKSGGSNYESILVDDFLKSRQVNDSHLTMKYHNLILNKVMVHMAKIEVTDSQENIDNKSLAFAEALAKLTGIKTDK
jgi:hypothetical protein